MVKDLLSSFLEVQDLSVEIGNVQVLRHISFDLGKGARLGVIGESGSGKSITARALFGDLPPNSTSTGKIRIGGNSVLDLDKGDLDTMRRTLLSLIPQNPGVTLDPSMKIQRQISEVLTPSGVDAADRALALLTQMGFDGDETEIMQRYPHQLSGGQRQRIAIAIAIGSNPELLVADEPTSSLDSLLARDMIEVIKAYAISTSSTVLLITHNLEEVSNLCTDVAVLYRGNLVEIGPVDRIFDHPQHPYTDALVKSYKELYGSRRYLERAERSSNDYVATAHFSSCPYYTSCPKAAKRCLSEAPTPISTKTGVMCHFPL